MLTGRWGACLHMRRGQGVPTGGWGTHMDGQGIHVCMPTCGVAGDVSPWPGPTKATAQYRTVYPGVGNPRSIIALHN